MKIFISSVAVFILICVLVSVNAVTVCKYTDHLITCTKNLPASPDEGSADRLIQLWLKYESILNITISHNVTDQIELVLHDIKNADDPAIYKSKCDSLLILLRDMKDTAGLSLDRII